MSAQVIPMPANTVDVLPASREVAEARAAAIRGALEFAVDLFIAAYRERDHETLGYGTGQAGWETYLRDRFSDLEFRLPAELRRERVEAMARAGMTVRPIAATPGMGSRGTVGEDLKALRAAGRIIDQDGATIGVDGKRQQRRQQPTTPTTPATKLGTVDAVVAAAETLVASGKCPDGVTTLDLMARLKWRQGPASAAQSRAVRRGRLLWAGAWRDGFAVYAIPRPALEAPAEETP